MQENREMMELNEHLTDADIMWAIRYLDSDLCAKKAAEDTGTAVGIGIALLTALTGALTYIGLYVRVL
jgi:class 3 adenylate cyclase